MSATGKPGARDAGFTLLEMLVTVAILALIGGIAFPRLQNLLARQTLIEARSAVALTVARARSEAIRSDRPTRVTLVDQGSDQGSDQESDQGEALAISRLSATLSASPPMPATPLPAGVIVAWPRDGVVMFGDGSASPASGMVRAGDAISRFAIDPVTARLDFAS